MKEIIQTGNAPAAIGPYSQAVKQQCGQIVFCSMQIPLDPKTGELAGLTAADQCLQTIDNIKAVLEASGAGLVDVVKVTLYLVDMAEFGEVNRVYSEYFESDPPARTVVGVSSLPKNARVAVDAIAIV